MLKTLMASIPTQLNTPRVILIMDLIKTAINLSQSPGLSPLYHQDFVSASPNVSHI